MTETSAFHLPETWDERSRDYEQSSEPFTSRMAFALADMIGIGQCDHVIDIACGPGALALHLARAGAAVTAIDHSQAMIGLLRHRAAVAGLEERIEAQAMDGQALAFPDDQFDVALSAFGIFLFPDYEAGLREAVRVLRPGGRFGTSTWQGSFGAGPSLLLHGSYRELFPDREIAFPASGVVEWGDTARLRRALEQAGLEEVRIEARTEDWSFQSMEEVTEKAEAMFRMFPSWAALSGKEREMLFGRLIEKLGPDLSVPSTALLATARKPLS